MISCGHFPTVFDIDVKMMAPIANITPMVSVTETQAVINVERVNVELAGETRQSDKKCIDRDSHSVGIKTHFLGVKAQGNVG